MGFFVSRKVRKGAKTQRIFFETQVFSTKQSYFLMENTSSFPLGGSRGLFPKIP
jgi:hypothetical protein